MTPAVPPATMLSLTGGLTPVSEVSPRIFGVTAWKGGLEGSTCMWVSDLMVVTTPQQTENSHARDSTSITLAWRSHGDWTPCSRHGSPETGSGLAERREALADPARASPERPRLCEASHQGCGQASRQFTP